MNQPFTKTAAFLFGIGAIIHLLRLFTQFSVQIGGQLIPLWVNVIGFFVGLTFAIMLWRESQRKSG